VKALLDENLDHALRKLLGQHEVFTVTFMGWTGLQNGALLQAAEERDGRSADWRPIAHMRTESYRQASGHRRPFRDSTSHPQTEPAENNRSHQRSHARKISSG
jgi:hypothetical protein